MLKSMIYKKKAPLIVFLVPAFLFIFVFLYYPFFQNILNTLVPNDNLEFASYYEKNERIQQKIVDSINSFFAKEG